MTGARIMTTLLNGLETDDKTIGLETAWRVARQAMTLGAAQLAPSRRRDRRPRRTLPTA